MTTIKLLSAGLIATVMFTASADAHANSVANRHVAMKGNASVASSAGRWIYSDVRIPTSHAGELTTPPHDDPGGVCDHGDNGMIC